MSRRWAGLAAAAGCLFASACAGIPNPAADDYVRLPVSMLVSNRALPFKLAQMKRGPGQLTVLLHQPSAAESSPVALISVSRPGAKSFVSVQRLPGNDAGELEVATWEHLYSLAIAQEPEAQFCLSHTAQPCDAARRGYPHNQLLRELARAREQAVARARPSKPMVPWHVVTMTPAAGRGGDADEVAVRVTSDHATTLAGASIFFNKAPHLSCVATIGANGIATCHLVDQHGDDGGHPEHDHAPVIATFPGDVRADRVVVPTTIVLEPG